MPEHEQRLYLGCDTDNQAVFMWPAMACRHGLIAGATGTGKTVSLKLLAEQFSAMGVPVVVTDVKGDLSGTAVAGSSNKHIEARLAQMPLDGFTYQGYPVVLWDVFGQAGHPLRATLGEMGPVVLARLLQLNGTQQDILVLLFNVADDEGMLLLDWPDLVAMLQFALAHARTLSNDYGHMSKGSLNAILRKVRALESEGMEAFCGEPALDLMDWLSLTPEGKGSVHVLCADKLFLNHRLYGAVLLWLLAELYERLPEVGDLDKPRLVVFFDEAHLLFDELPAPVLDKVEQVVRLIRSKGVGLYFATQQPADIPQAIVGQLGHRIQHALRTFTPHDQKQLKALVDGFRTHPTLDLQAVIPALKVGEALVSVLDENGQPTIPAQTMMAPPTSRIGPLGETERHEIIRQSRFYGRFEERIDRTSAHEQVKARLQNPEKSEKSQQPQRASEANTSRRGQSGSQAFLNSVLRALGSQLGRIGMTALVAWLFGRQVSGGRSRRRQTSAQAFGNSVARSIGTQVGRQLTRGVLGSLQR